MITEYPDDMLSLLAAMKGEAWSDAQIQRYTLALAQLPAKIGRYVVKRMCLETWRPSPMDILRSAAKQASPFPTADEAYAEIMHKAESIGLYGTPDPQNARCFLPGPPPFSHPLVGQAIQHCGGWRSICTGEAQMQEGLSKQIKGAYERVAAKWVESVIPSLSLPAKQRPAELFPRWTAHVLPPMWHERSERLAIAPALLQTPPSSEIACAMPPELRAKLRKIGASMPDGDEPHAETPPEKLQEVEAELLRIRERLNAAQKESGQKVGAK